MVKSMVVPWSTQPACQDTQILKKVWEAIHPESCPHDYNFHMHTTYSDGKLTPEELIEQAVTIGLKGMAITDHHSIRGYQAGQNCLEQTRRQSPHTPLPHLWTGVEVTSNLLDIGVHILGYGFEPQHSAMKPYLQGESPQGERALAENVIWALHQAGGLTVLAHPSRYRHPATELVPAAAALGIDGIEVYYAYDNPKPWKTSLKETEQAKYLSEIYGLLCTCGTDTHGTNLLQRV